MSIPKLIKIAPSTSQVTVDATSSNLPVFRTIAASTYAETDPITLENWLPKLTSIQSSTTDMGIAILCRGLATFTCTSDNPGIIAFGQSGFINDDLVTAFGTSGFSSDTEVISWGQSGYMDLTPVLAAAVVEFNVHVQYTNTAAEALVEFNVYDFLAIGSVDFNVTGTTPPEPVTLLYPVNFDVIDAKPSYLITFNVTGEVQSYYNVLFYVVEEFEPILLSATIQLCGGAGKATYHRLGLILRQGEVLIGTKSNMSLMKIGTTMKISVYDIPQVGATNELQVWVDNVLRTTITLPYNSVMSTEVIV